MRGLEKYIVHRLQKLYYTEYIIYVTQRNTHFVLDISHIVSGMEIQECTF
jgi:hypothetical protein